MNAEPNPAVIAFDAFLNEPPEYEDQRMVRDYRHAAYAKWRPVLADYTALAASHARLLDALKNMLYMADELTADKLIEHDGDECSFWETEELCRPYCEACGCIGAKVASARAAIAAADEQRTRRTA